MFIGSKPSVLIVDDDTAILKTFKRIFERKGYCVTTVEKGKQALEQINSNHYDIALVDLALPDMEGSALFPIIKESSPKTLRIMLTGEVLRNDVEGAQVLLGKPVNPEKLLSIIDTKLKNRDSEF